MRTDPKDGWARPFREDDPNDPVPSAVRPISKAAHERDQLLRAILGAVLLVLGLWAAGVFDHEVERPHRSENSDLVRAAQ